MIDIDFRPTCPSSEKVIPYVSGIFPNGKKATINQSINQSINRLINQSINQTNKQSINQSPKPGFQYFSIQRRSQEIPAIACRPMIGPTFELMSYHSSKFSMFV